MTNVEKIIADLIDQQKITGEQAVILIKSLQINEKPSYNWTTSPSTSLYDNRTNTRIDDLALTAM